MVGIVIVAHSAELAESVRILVEQTLREPVPLCPAGGVDDPAHPFGTDVSRIQQAIESVYSDDGVLVLMDMGSAVLSAESALDLLPDAVRSRILLCEAPVVEGAVAAAVASEGGRNLEEVAEEARDALQAKGGLLGISAAPRPEWKPVSTAGFEISKRLTVTNPLGIHARPAARLVTIASRFEAVTGIRNLSTGSPTVSARSISQVSLLGVGQGQDILITASGPDAEEALAALDDLVQQGFGESALQESEQEPPVLPLDETHLPPAEGQGLSRPLQNAAFQGIPASPGVAAAPAALYLARAGPLPEREPLPAEEEWARLSRAIESVRVELREVREEVLSKAGEDEAAIFDAHLLSLDDEHLMESVRSKLAHAHPAAAEGAWSEAVEELAASYRDLSSPYFRSRAADLDHLKDRVLRELVGEAPLSFELSDERVVVAADLSPEEVGRLDAERVAGICTAYGGRNSHSAILARALGIPAVVGLGPAIIRLTEGTMLLVDGDRGLVRVDPGVIPVPESGVRPKDRPPLYVRERAVTKDGRRVVVKANISGGEQVATALRYGAEGIGVLRTEFLFLRKPVLPPEDEQVEVYRRIAEELGPLPLVIRVLDVGGDKPLNALTPKRESNPFLGVRGLRLLLEYPDLFKTQLRAILRGNCSTHEPEPEKKTGILLPMVSTVDEVTRTRQLLSRVQEDLYEEGIPFQENVGLGIMVEVPSSAIMARELAPRVDFMSIGTNDLVQYVMAADRTNGRVTPLYDTLHPAVLRMVSAVVSAGREYGRPVSVCGEIAGDASAAPLLVGLGVDELSMSPLSIPAVKEAVSGLDIGEAAEIALAALKMERAEEVRDLLFEAGKGEARER